jgi:hypothetical protein
MIRCGGRPTTVDDRRTLRIVVQDPGVRGADGQVITAQISLPWEDLIDGPTGYAVYVVDYDATARVMYRPATPPAPVRRLEYPRAPAQGGATRLRGGQRLTPPELEAIVLGYVRGNEPTYLCLSHDVVAHETAHALLDGLRDKFTAPSSADQAALHEGFADIVALLSVHALPDLVRHLLTPIADTDADPGRDTLIPTPATSRPHE